MTLLPSIRYISAGTLKYPAGKISLQCFVKPSATKQRQGILDVSDHAIRICVSSPPRHGMANEAVREVISAALNCPKSNVEVVRGLKSKEKNVLVGGLEVVEGQEEAWVAKIRTLLQAAVL